MKSRFAKTDAAGRVIGEWIDFYNSGRPHSALDGATPREAYRAGRPVDMMDKGSRLAHIPTGPTATGADRDLQPHPSEGNGVGIVLIFIVGGRHFYARARRNIQFNPNVEDSGIG
jgi:hypothetical protein